VQGVDVMGATSTRAVRFREIGVEPVALRSIATAAVGDSLRVVATGVSSFAVQTLRAATAGRLSADDALDMSRNVDMQVAEAWLNETGQVFSVDARTLVRLADAGMPSRMIDLLVALSYPQTFAVRPSTTSGGGGSVGNFGGTRIGTMSSYGVTRSMCDAMYSGYGGLGFYGSAYNGCYGSSQYGNMYSRYGYGSRYGNGYYYGNQPIIIINRGDIPTSGQSNNARAVNGRGYTRSEPSATSSGYSGSSGSSSSSRGSSGSGSSGSGSTSGGSSSGGDAGGSSSGGRTAKARGGA